MIETVAFINLRLSGAEALLQETHDYIKWQAPIDVRQMLPNQTLKVSCEAMRVTVRMTQIVAWFILQKSVLSGELSRKDVLSEDCRVLQGHHYLETESENDPAIPYRLRELLKESRLLYLQIVRLDALARKRCSLDGRHQRRPLSVL